MQLPHCGGCSAYSAQIWGAHIPAFPTPVSNPFATGSNTPQALSPTPSTYNFPISAVTKERGVSTEELDTAKDEESGAYPNESLQRPVILTSAIYVGLAMALLVFILYGLSIGQVSFTR